MTIAFPFPVPSDSPFGLHNIPFGIYSTPGQTPRAGTAVGDYVIDLDTLVHHGIFADAKLTQSLDGVFLKRLKPYLNDFATLPPSDRQAVRQAIIHHITNADSPIFKDESLPKKALIPMKDVKMHLPMHLTDYTDFYSSWVHADKAGRAMNIPIPPAFWQYPMAYNGRVSSVSVSGTNVIRPKGFFLRNPGDKHVEYQASQEIDFEVEMGCFISAPLAPGDVVTAGEAWKHVFGYVLLNDWSARDIQKYEMHPFGPLHSKSFLTSISPWVVTPDALRGSLARPVESSKFELSSLLRSDPNNHAEYDIQFPLTLSRKGSTPVKIVQTNLTDAHWDSLQMIAYQSSSGCGLNTGDLLGSGTTSSPTPESRDPNSPSGCGCLFEANACKEPLASVANKEKIIWLEDGDLVTMEGWFTTPDGKRAGFGPLSGLVRPPRGTTI